MAVTVRIPTQLRELAEGKSEVEVEGETVGEALQNLVQKYPGFKERLFDEGGNVRRFLNVFLSDEDIRYRDGVDTKIKDGDVISIIPAVAGGC